MVETGSVDCQINDGVGTVTFSHPRSNSLPGALLREIAKTIEALGKDRAANVIVLQSLGDKAFCAGASFDELLAVKDLTQSKHFFSGFAILISAMKQSPKLIITRVQGKAVGGGVGIVSASDYVFAHDSASIRLSELALGIGPFIIGPAVQRKVGISNFSALAIDADWRSAEWAKTNGLYTETFPEISELNSKVETFSKHLAKCSAEAMTQLKKILWEGTESWGELMEQRVGITSSLALGSFVQSAIAAANKR